MEARQMLNEMAQVHLRDQDGGIFVLRLSSYDYFLKILLMTIKTRLAARPHVDAAEEPEAVLVLTLGPVLSLRGSPNPDLSPDLGQNRL